MYTSIIDQHKEPVLNILNDLKKTGKFKKFFPKKGANVQEDMSLDEKLSYAITQILRVNNYRDTFDMICIELELDDTQKIILRKTINTYKSNLFPDTRIRIEGFNPKPKTGRRKIYKKRKPTKKRKLKKKENLQKKEKNHIKKEKLTKNHN